MSYVCMTYTFKALRLNVNFYVSPHFFYKSLVEILGYLYDYCWEFFIVCNFVLMHYDDFCYDLEIQVVDVIIFLFHCLFLLCLISLVSLVFDTLV